MLIETLPLPVAHRDSSELTTLLLACVRGGASIGFLVPIAEGEAASYWGKVYSDFASGNKIVLVAREAAGERIVGSVQLGLETRANGRHRAEVQKLMVLPECRLRGIAAKLMTGIDAEARKRGVRLLFLDTSEGDSGATAFYSKNAYTYVGGIPDYALDPDGKPSKNAIFYKQLA